MSHEVEHEIELKQLILRVGGNIIWYLMQVLYSWTYLLFGKAQNQSAHSLTGRTTDYGLALIIHFLLRYKPISLKTLKMKQRLLVMSFNLLHRDQVEIYDL